MGENLILAVRGSSGFILRRGMKDPLVVFDKTKTPSENPCRVFKFSNNGDYFCYCDTKKTVLIESTTGNFLFDCDLPRTSSLHFSPKDKVLCTFSPYAVYGAKKEGENRTPSPNLHLWSVPDGKLLAVLVAQKQTGWQPTWTDDESVFARLVGSELLFHHANNYEKYDSKLVIPKLSDFALSPGSAPHKVACYVPPTKGQPGVVQLRTLGPDFPLLSNKTFWKCDNVSLLWNSKGNALIVLTTIDVDKSNQSYYGEQNVFLLLTNGESSVVPLAKNGPVYSVKWNPNGKDFVVCYGFMPAKVTLYTWKGLALFDMGVGPRNDVYYNRFGTILLVCGFGNISSGNMEFWAVEQRKQIVKIQVPSTTSFEWAPDGQHFMTATTTPRLRIDNSYRLWHYTGLLISEVLYPNNQELWQVLWRPLPENVYHSFPLAPLTAEQKAMAGLLTTQKDSNLAHPAERLPVGAISKSGAYVPPHQRNGKLPMKDAAKNGPALSEVQKKRKALEKKVNDITSLKKRLENGEQLEANQLAKIDKESELLTQIAELEL